MEKGKQHSIQGRMCSEKLIKFLDGGRIQVKERRLFAAKEEVEAGMLGKKEEPKGYHPYFYEH